MRCAHCDELIREGEQYTTYDNPGASFAGSTVYLARQTLPAGTDPDGPETPPASPPSGTADSRTGALAPVAGPHSGRFGSGPHKTHVSPLATPTGLVSAGSQG